MRFLAVFILGITTTTAALAHREHGAHKHGEGKLAIAFDKTEGQMEFNIPAESIVGFEHKAVKPRDVEKQKNAIELFEKELSNMVRFDPGLMCQLKKHAVQVEEKSKKHSDFVAHYKIACEKSPAGTSITFDFKPLEKVMSVEIIVLAGTLQKKVTYKRTPLTVDLK